MNNYERPPELSDAIADNNKSLEKVLGSFDNLNKTLELWADKQDGVNQIVGRIVTKTEILVYLGAGTLATLLMYAL